MVDIIEGLDKVIAIVEGTPQINVAGVRGAIDRELGGLTGMHLADPLRQYYAGLGDQVNQAGALTGLRALREQYRAAYRP